MLNINEEDKRIYSNAFSEIRLKKKYHSPFRPDPTPSFEFFINNISKRLWWHDWGSGEKGNCYDFLDRWGGPIGSKQIKISEPEQKPPPEIIHSEVWDLKFWKQFGITKETLSLFKVRQVESVNGRRHQQSFIYLFDNKEKYRVYSPASPKKYKFWGSMSKMDVYGWDQLPEAGDLVVITKSMKDVMALYECGIAAIAFASETITPRKDKIDELKRRFKNVIILYDNDEEGVKQSNRIKSIHGLRNVFMKSAKDFSDCVKAKTQREAKKELIEQIKKEWINTEPIQR